MNKYLLTLKLTWGTFLTYRTSVIMWRLRNFLSSIMSLTVWFVIFEQQGTVFNYQRSEMITYIFLISILQSFILATSLNGLAGNIYSGNISFELLKPVNLFAYLGIQDVADKITNIVFVLGESFLLYLIFQPVLQLPSLVNSLIFVVWIGLGILLNFFISLLFGAIGFWSPDAWGPKFLFFMLVDLTAGKLYPLDILPEFIQKAVYLTPFPYLSYAQVQIFLERLSPQQIILNSLALIGWLIILGTMTIVVWRKGMRDYTAAGQ